MYGKTTAIHIMLLSNQTYGSVCFPLRFCFFFLLVSANMRWISLKLCESYFVGSNNSMHINKIQNHWLHFRYLFLYSSQMAEFLHLAIYWWICIHVRVQGAYTTQKKTIGSKSRLQFFGCTKKSRQYVVHVAPCDQCNFDQYIKYCDRHMFFLSKKISLRLTHLMSSKISVYYFSLNIYNFTVTFQTCLDMKHCQWISRKIVYENLENWHDERFCVF